MVFEGIKLLKQISDDVDALIEKLEETGNKKEANSLRGFKELVTDKDVSSEVAVVVESIIALIALKAND